MQRSTNQSSKYSVVTLEDDVAPDSFSSMEPSSAGRRRDAADRGATFMDSATGMPSGFRRDDDLTSSAGYSDLKHKPSSFGSRGDSGLKTYNAFLGEPGFSHEPLEAPEGKTFDVFASGSSYAEPPAKPVTDSHQGAGEAGPFGTRSMERSAGGGLPTPAATAAASKHPKVSTDPKGLSGEYDKSKSVLINKDRGTTGEMALKVLTRCTESVRASDDGSALVDSEKYRLKGNVSFGLEATPFELQVLAVEMNGVKQLVVEMKHTARNGADAFRMILQRIAWDLHQDRLAESWADGTDIIRPARDILAERKRLGLEADDIDDDSLAPPSMLGLSPYVTNRRSPRKKSSGIRLDRDKNNDLINLWGNMMQSSRERSALLKTIAMCSENEKNATVLAASQDLLQQIIWVLKSEGQHGERDQQSVHCAMIIIENVIALKIAAEFLIKTKIVEALVDNLYYFAGIRTKRAHMRSGSIQDAAVASLATLAAQGDFVVGDTTKAKLRTLMEHKNIMKIRNPETKDNLVQVCRALNVV